VNLFDKEPSMTRLCKLLAAFAIVLAAGTGLAADQGIRGSGRYGTAGCGLGSLIFQDQPGMVQVLAATTNGTFGTQTFGITSGTMNCGAGMTAHGTRNFVDANRDALAKDMSRGQGETIGALTVLAGCKDSRQVGAALQANFKAIVPSEKATADEITPRLLQALQADKSLGCQIAG
jgi:hypothetical protein